MNSILFQLFAIRHATAQILEKEQEEERKKIMAKEPKREGTPNNMIDLNSSQPDPDASGVWKESESGLEWVALPPGEDKVCRRVCKVLAVSH